MTRSRTIIVAGAGIGGLTAALALAKAGFRIVVLERAERLEETGAGIQLSPNASGILCALGLEAALAARAVTPAEIRLRRSGGATVLSIPIGDAAFRYGAPYWVIHRADLQAVLLEATLEKPQIVLRLGTQFEDVAVHSRGVTVRARTRAGGDHVEQGIALVGADGLWSAVRRHLGHADAGQVAGRTAWRTVVPAERVSPEFRRAETQLWLGSDAHLVVYPVQAGKTVNIVAVVGDDWNARGWSTPGEAGELLARFRHWAYPARELLATPENWLKWALVDRPPSSRWGTGPVTLLGDAAHPMLPFLAQGGAMAIEDAAVLAACLARKADETGLRTYEGLRRARTARVQNAARRNNIVYHLGGPAALARDLALAMMGGERLLRHYDWLYDWRAV